MNFNLPDSVKQALQFEEQILPNGLCVRVLPMPGFKSVHAIYATNFGSINKQFKQDDKVITLPEGVAHFLEHKMFENEDGVDAFSLYAQTGASANAYTGFDRTSYIFTATDKIDENLDILLSFVGHPHFTKESVAKEQGIIGQEIGMGEDDPDRRLFFGMLQGLYKNHPVRDEIAGSVESISYITADMLYECTNAFYHPSNMALCVAGDITMEQVLKAVERAQLPQNKIAPIERLFPQEPLDVAQKNNTLAMSVAMPILALGFKEEPLSQDLTKNEIIYDLLCELLAGQTSTLYQTLYDEGLVQPDFSAGYNLVDEALSLFFIAQTPDTDYVQQAILKEIERQRTQGIDKQQFEIAKKMMYGNLISELDSVERIASMLVSSYFRGGTPIQELELLASITLEDIQQALNTLFNVNQMSSMIIMPSEN